jgi:hypothetical protein
MTMSERPHWMNDVKSIEQMRDELRLKAKLLKADLHDQWERLEKQWHHLEHDLQPVREAVGTTAKELGGSTKELLETVRAGYARIRDAVRSGT